ncbi:hypothetical protein [Bradyrhizobium sp. I1.7.5]|uniref:hypothetical protein n=1 Tax=Bradyrhizobium sp. I1.7.5 TaxID=3156363 RepID=UPI00339452A2
MDRRKLILAGVAAGSAGLPTTISATVNQRRISIEAPDDVHIEQVAAKPGNIRQGDLLFKLKSFAIESMQIKIDLFKQHIAIMERPFADGRIDQEIEHLKRKASLALEVMSASQRAINRRTAAYKSIFFDKNYTAFDPPPLRDSALDLSFFPMPTTTTASVGPGPINIDDPSGNGQIIQVGSVSRAYTKVLNPDYKSDYSLVVEHNKNTADYLEAKVAAEQSTLKKQDHLDKLDLTKTKLQRYDSLLKEKQDTLSILASVNAAFMPVVVTGSFVKKGHLLGELML